MFIFNKLIKTFRKFSSALLIKIFGVFFSFLLSFTIGKYFGAETAGIYFLSINVVIISVTFSLFGVNQSLLKHSSKSFLNKQLNEVRRYFINSLYLGLILSIIVSISLFFFTPILAISILGKPDLIFYLKLFTWIIIPTVILYIISDYLKSIGKINSGLMTRDFGIPIISFFLLIVFFNQSVIFTVFYTRLIAAYLIFIVVLIILIYHASKNKLTNFQYSHKISKKLLTTAKPLFVAALAGILMKYSESILVAIYCDISEVGYYELSFKFASLLTIIGYSVNSVVAPNISYKIENAKSELKLDLQKAMLFAFLIAVPIFTFLLIFGKEFFLFIGKDFGPSVGVFRILLIGQVINLVTGPVGFVLALGGSEKLFGKINIIFLLIKIIFGLLIIKYMGIIGAAIISSSILILINVSYLIYVQKIYKINLFKIRLSS